MIFFPTIDNFHLKSQIKTIIRKNKIFSLINSINLNNLIYYPLIYGQVLYIMYKKFILLVYEIDLYPLFFPHLIYFCHIIKSYVIRFGNFFQNREDYKFYETCDLVSYSTLVYKCVCLKS